MLQRHQEGSIFWDTGVLEWLDKEVGPISLYCKLKNLRMVSIECFQGFMAWC